MVDGRVPARSTQARLARRPWSTPPDQLPCRAEGTAAGPTRWSTVYGLHYINTKISALIGPP